MKHTNLKYKSYFNRTFVPVFGIILFVTLLNGCSKDNDPDNKENNKSPHKVRIELNHPYSEMYEVFFTGSYEYDHELYSLMEDGTYSLPLSIEFDLPREFDNISLAYTKIPIPGKKHEGVEAYVSVNIYIDERLIVSGASAAMACGISNNASENKFLVLHGVKMYEVDKGTGLGKNEDYGKPPYQVRIEVASGYPGASVSLLASGYYYQNEDYEILFDAPEELEIYDRPLPFSAEFKMYHSFSVLSLIVAAGDNKDFTVKLFVNEQFIDWPATNEWGIFLIDRETVQEALTR
ncbi:MAG: hypothetical protein LBP63_08270 [Prevotellaceae bacterium]|jgi:hypothetical protein|nr:hypothetical protein [Prevotellaceae bacterium]